MSSDPKQVKSRKNNLKLQQVEATKKKPKKSKMEEIFTFKKSKEEKAAEAIPVTQENIKQALTNIIIRVRRGENLQSILGLSNSLIEQMYSVAYGFYVQGKYLEARGIFQVLTSAKPSCYKFHLGLGACYHQLKLYEQAAFSFFLALNEQPQNPIPSYYIADSFFRGNLIAEADEFADITLHLCGNDSKYQSVKEKTLLMKGALQHLMGNHPTETSVSPPPQPDKKTATGSSSVKSTKKAPVKTTAKKIPSKKKQQR